MRRYNNKSKQIALGGIITLLSTVSLYISSILPTNKLLFFALSTFLFSVTIIEVNIKFTLLVFFSSSLLSFIIIPNKIIILPYVIFFGYYAIIKAIIERINILAVELLLKLLLFNLSMYIIYTLANNVIFGEIIINIPVWVVFLLMQLAFIIYDYAFSIVIYLYRRKIRPKIRIK